MTHDESKSGRCLLNDAQRALLDLYNVELLEVIYVPRIDETGLALLRDPANPLRQICLYLSLPLSDWARHIKYLIANPDSPHEAGACYGTTRISPRGYGKPIRS